MKSEMKQKMQKSTCFKEKRRERKEEEEEESAK